MYVKKTLQTLAIQKQYKILLDFMMKRKRLVLKTP